MDEKVKNDYRTKFSDVLGAREARKILTRLERISYKLAPINSQTGNTQTIYRWELNTDNPHLATQETCQAIFVRLADDLLGYLKDGEGTYREPLTITDKGVINRDELTQILSNSSRLGSLELPVTYRSFGATPVHSVENVYWFKPPAHRYALEQWLDNRTIVTKIQVKAFLTDRRLSDKSRSSMGGSPEVTTIFYPHGLPTDSRQAHSSNCDI